MSERVAQKIGVPAVIAIAAVTVAAYAFWGSTVLHAGRTQATDPAGVLASR